MTLKRILGAPTAWCISMGVAIGSGICRTPGEIAGHLPSPTWIVFAWLIGGAIIVVQGLVTTEIATRFSKAGGEYVFLKEAYGNFIAFFYGWANLIFVIGAGSAVIAIAFGDFTCDLLRCSPDASVIFALIAVAGVTAVNIAGLRTGAVTQNVFTALRVLALVAIVIAGFVVNSTQVSSVVPSTSPSGPPALGALLAALLSVLWSYDGTTESVKLAEEIKDIRRALPRAVIGSALCLTVLYAAVNLALLRVIPAPEMAGLASVPGAAMERLFGPPGRVAMLLVAMLVCLGSISSTFTATIRVTFAMARDGLSFRILAKMSDRQAPIPALLTAAVITASFCFLRDFTQVLGIYFLASTILFALTYASLIVFRSRDESFPAHVFRCPCGPVLAVTAIVTQSAIAVYIALTDPRNSLYTLALLAALGLFYFLWPSPGKPSTAES